MASDAAPGGAYGGAPAGAFAGSPGGGAYGGAPAGGASSPGGSSYYSPASAASEARPGGSPGWEGEARPKGQLALPARDRSGGSDVREMHSARSSPGTVGGAAGGHGRGRERCFWMGGCCSALKLWNGALRLAVPLCLPLPPPPLPTAQGYGALPAAEDPVAATARRIDSLRQAGALLHEDEGEGVGQRGGAAGMPTSRSCGNLAVAPSGGSQASGLVREGAGGGVGALGAALRAH